MMRNSSETVTRAARKPLATRRIDRRRLLELGAGLGGLALGLPLFGCGGPEPEPPPCCEPRDLRIDRLALAIQHEYGAIIQYCNHAALLQPAADDAAPERRLYQQIIADEVRHAIDLNAAMVRLGARPGVAIWPPLLADERRAMLDLDIQAEEGAIELYRSLLVLDFPPPTLSIIRRILADEQRHRRLLLALPPPPFDTP